ncbi:phage head closure protein [Rhizobium sp. OAE497]|uniref:phage head closure protein n=1 Tax=Rhizobium sp. OAE497 TaxID=2663796 RepID=UPI0018F68C5B
MRAVVLDPGAMSARLVLERPVELADGQGGAGVSFEGVASLWARIEPVGESSEERAGADLVTLTHRVWVRFRTDIRSGMRLRKGERVFVIRSLRDPDEGGRYLACLCEEEGR